MNNGGNDDAKRTWNLNYYNMATCQIYICFFSSYKLVSYDLIITKIFSYLLMSNDVLQFIAYVAIWQIISVKFPGNFVESKILSKTTRWPLLIKVRLQYTKCPDQRENKW